MHTSSCKECSHSLCDAVLLVTYLPLPLASALHLYHQQSQAVQAVLHVIDVSSRQNVVVTTVTQKHTQVLASPQSGTAEAATQHHASGDSHIVPSIKVEDASQH